MEAHFLSHLERHCELRRHRWFGPYSRAYEPDVHQAGSLLNLFLTRATGDRRWLRGDFRSGGEWAVILAQLEFPRPRARVATRELALSYPVRRLSSAGAC